jgi:putative protease
VNRIELLAPARDLECGLAAIDCGADAVYVGPPRFGAREAAGNNLADIARLVEHAHRYWARVYATVNTLLRDEEIPHAVRLIHELHAIGVDALVIADAGLLECDLPPLPLIASTQMHNHTPERVAFLEKVGFQRAILARELTLEEIRAIRQATERIELECFIHGALCVGYSGQCYLSYALGGRSGNRGQCAQPCRKRYTLVDARGRVLEEGRHLLSVRDLNLTGDLGALIDAGVSSFKIEGRLKDRAYVANVVSWYRRQLDERLRERGLRRASSGTSAVDFTPDPAKTFNRGYTTYFLHGRSERIGSPETPKMAGTPLGRVAAVGIRGVTIDTRIPLHPGDGICFFDRRGELRGAAVSAVDGRTIVLDGVDGVDGVDGIEEGMLVYRNRDQEFLKRIRKSRMERRIAVALNLRANLVIEAEDEDGNRAELAIEGAGEAAEKPERALATLRKQLQKMGGTDFVCSQVAVEIEPAPFVAVRTLNALRRGVLEKLAAVRARNRPVAKGGAIRNDAPFPEKALSYRGNVLNRRAEAFYRRHGVERIEPAAESGLNLRGRAVMTTRYCLKHQLGLCPPKGAAAPPPEPLVLVDEEGRRLEPRFDCARCEMDVYLSDEDIGAGNPATI